MNTAINIIGLSLALTCVMFAMLFWKNERSYDSFHVKNPDIYRLYSNVTDKNGNTIVTGGTGQVQGPAFHRAAPEIKSFVRVMGGDIINDISAGNQAIQIKPLYVDRNFLELFSFPLLRGSVSTALNDMSSIVLSESTAKKIFGSANVVGKTLRMSADPSFDKLGKPLIVSAVAKDPPANSSLQFSALLTFDFMRLSFQDENWLNTYLSTFVLLQPNADIKSVIEKCNAVYNVHAKEQLQDSRFNFAGFDPKITYGLQPITDIHLNPLADSGFVETGVVNGSNPIYAYIFLAITCFILVMAAVNFINISISGSLSRAKAICIRRINGSSRAWIIRQYLTESAMVCIVALAVSVASVYMLLPVFNSLTEKQIVFENLLDIPNLFLLSLLLAVTVLFTSLYPAMALADFKPAEVLYGRQSVSRGVMGRALIVFQFFLATFLLIASVVYNRQMNYVAKKDLGYNASGIIRISIEGNRDYKSISNYFRNELSKEPGVRSISFNNSGYINDVEANQKNFRAFHRIIDETFITTFEIPLTNGKNYTPGNQGSGALVNQAFVNAMGIQDPIGKLVNVNPGNDSSVKRIIGVMSDFHFNSLRELIGPAIMYTAETPPGNLFVKFHKTMEAEGIAAVQRVFNRAMPDASFQYRFLEDINRQQYQQEQRWRKIINIATLISFIICCLGLFGLAHLHTARRVKEIGVRKVLGATAGQIVSLLSIYFLRLIGVSFAIAAPIAWMLMNRWLQDFAYRKEMDISVFLVSATIVVVTALAAVIFQAVRAAISNPAKSLRIE